MYSILLATAALAAASQPSFDVGRANWRAFPTFSVERALPTDEMVSRASNILRESQCRLDGQSHSRFDITVPYAVQLGPDGAVTRLLVKDIGCPAMQVLVANVVYELAGAGDFRSIRMQPSRWYASEINFNLR